MTTVLFFVRTVDGNQLLVNNEMEGKVRLSSDMVKSFDGEGDLMAWLAKVKLVAKNP